MRFPSSQTNFSPYIPLSAESPSLSCIRKGERSRRCRYPPIPSIPLRPSPGKPPKSSWLSRPAHKSGWDADRLSLDHVGRDTFYGLLASLRGRLFRNADFAEFYCADNSGESVPPSLLATAPLLQSNDKVSDAETKARADFDIRWKVALGIDVGDRPFAKSTLQVFRAQLILHYKLREVFESSLRLARESGYLKRGSMKVGLDTTNFLGRGKT